MSGHRSAPVDSLLIAIYYEQRSSFYDKVQVSVLEGNYRFSGNLKILIEGLLEDGLAQSRPVDERTQGKTIALSNKGKNLARDLIVTGRKIVRYSTQPDEPTSNDGPAQMDVPPAEFVLRDVTSEYRPSDSIDSSLWTGLPKSGVLDADAVSRLKIALTNVDSAVSNSSATNEEKAQARAFVLAIHALADAPEPPADLIWEMVVRANHLAGIASFFIALIALYAAVAH